MRLIFAGTPAFAARALAALHDSGHELALVLTQPDRPTGRGMKLAPSAVKLAAQARSLELYQPARLRDAETQEKLRTAGADAMVVAAYGQILPEAMLHAARLGAINIHASLLPRWRGAAPIQRALLAGDALTGISIMQMDRGLDTGPVLAAESIPIAADETGGGLHDKLAELGAGLIVSTLARLESGALQARAQSESDACYAPKITKAEAAVDWRESAAVLERKVRAFHPVPGATAQMHGAGIKIWRAQSAAAQGEPGTVLEAGRQGIVIACGSAALRLLELQRPGGKRLPPAQFLAGFPLAPGEKLEFLPTAAI